MGITPINIDYESQEILKNEIQSMEFETSQEAEDTISFIESPSECCVGIVDIIGSTKVAATIQYSQVGKYYGTFLNAVTPIVKRFGGVVVKNAGDSLLYYFQSKSCDDKSMFVRCLECSLSMIEARCMINTKLHQQNLPTLNFRVSADYGKVTLATSSNPVYHDIFGSPVNFCSKINSIAMPNTVVVGGDLHQMAKSIPGYTFQEINSYSVGFKVKYPVFTIGRNDTKYTAIVESAIQKTLLDMGKPVLGTITCNLFKQHGCLISDCYEDPKILKNTLRDMFGNSHVDIVDTIKRNLGEYTQQKPIIEFLEKLN